MAMRMVTVPLKSFHPGREDKSALCHTVAKRKMAKSENSLALEASNTHLRPKVDCTEHQTCLNPAAISERYMQILKKIL